MDDATRIFQTAKAMWGIVDTIEKLRALALQVDPTADPLIMPLDAAALLVREGWTVGDFLRRFS